MKKNIKGASMSKKQSTGTKKVSRKQFATRSSLLIAASLIILLFLFDISPFGGSMSFYAKWVECGRKPVKTASLPGMIWYEETKPFELIRSGYQTYYCTPLQAEEAGYSANSDSYDFPHLRK